MNTRRSKWILIPAAFAALACMLPAPTSGWPSFVTEWQSVYPSSLSDDAILAASGTECQLCHGEISGGQPWNGYGWAIRDEIQGGASLLEALAAVERLNSDADPGGCSNIGEIEADAQPGWTAGPNNTLYFDGGMTEENQSPPAGLVGEDPAEPCCAHDLDGDDVVGITDLLDLLAAWGTDPGGPPDFDGDGAVGITDLLELLANWGPCP